MNIAVDVRPVERPSSRYRGVGLYTRRLCDALLKRNRCVERPHRFSVITSGLADSWNGRTSVRRVPAIRKPSRLQWIVDGFFLPRVLKQEEADIFHATEFTSIPVSERTKVIPHVYDMIPFLFWDEYSHRIPADYRYALKLACRRLERAPCIVTISQHSKNDIAEVTGYAHERIYVAYPGRPEELDNCKSAITYSRLNCTAPTDRGKPYFLYVGGTDVRKNVLFMIRAFARFAGREQDVQLVLVGDTFTMKSLPEVAEIFREIHSLGMADRVVTTGYVDDQRVRELYRGSVALIFPSLYEGFGLPVLEAMTYGAPVVAARTSSIPEVLGDTGIYFDPRDEDSLVTGMETVYGHPTRCGDLVERARQRARLFSWDTVADVVFGIYDQI